MRRSIVCIHCYNQSKKNNRDVWSGYRGRTSKLMVLQSDLYKYC